MKKGTGPSQPSEPGVVFLGEGDEMMTVWIDEAIRVGGRRVEKDTERSAGVVGIANKTERGGGGSGCQRTGARARAHPITIGKWWGC